MYRYANRRNFRVFSEIGFEEHYGDVRFKSGSGNMAVSCMLTYKALNGLAPPYLSLAFTHVADMPSRRRLWSASTDQLLHGAVLPAVNDRSDGVPDRWRK